MHIVTPPCATTAVLLHLPPLLPPPPLPASPLNFGNPGLVRCLGFSIWCNFHTVAMQGGEKQGKVQKLSKGEVLMLNIGSMCTGARVIAVSLTAI